MLFTCRKTKPAAAKRLLPRQVPATQQNVDILRVADGGFIDARHPGGHRIAASDRIRDAGPSRAATARSSRADLFHGADHPFPGNGPVDLRHGTPYTISYQGHYTLTFVPQSHIRGLPPSARISSFS